MSSQCTTAPYLVSHLLISIFLLSRLLDIYKRCALSLEILFLMFIILYSSQEDADEADLEQDLGRFAGAFLLYFLGDAGKGTPEMMITLFSVSFLLSMSSSICWMFCSMVVTSFSLSSGS